MTESFAIFAPLWLIFNREGAKDARGRHDDGTRIVKHRIQRGIENP